MYKQISPNMLKTFESCPRKFELKYIKGITMPVNDEIYEFGKNIHALASYFLRKENIDKMEKSLTAKELDVWSYLKSSKYFAYEVINSEYNLSVKLGDFIFGGRIDALVKLNETFYILDYKTGTIPKNPKYDYQTIIYTMAVKAFYKTEDVHFIYLDLKNKKDIEIEYTKQEDNECKEKLISTAKKIYSLEHTAKKNKCSCEYSIICY